MPLCQICKQRGATVHFTQIINGQKKELLVCRQCAGSQGIKIDLNSLLTGLLGLNAKEENIQSTVAKCDRCGMTIEEFNNTGKFGCSRCYEVFLEPMQALLTRIHGNTRHRGKTPQKYERRYDVQEEIELLKKELNECIRTEEYERAAEIRDRLKQLSADKGGPNHE